MGICSAPRKNGYREFKNWLPSHTRGGRWAGALHVHAAWSFVWRWPHSERTPAKGVTDSRAGSGGPRDEIGIDAIHEHDVALANAARTGLGMAPSDSSMITLELPDGFDPSRLDHLVTANRAGRLRVGFHLYNSTDDVEALLDALGVG